MLFSNRKFEKLSEIKPKLPDSTATSIRDAVFADCNELLVMANALREDNIKHRISKLNGAIPKHLTNTYGLRTFSSKLKASINQGGVVMIAENCKGPLGFICGAFEPCLWFDDETSLTEFGFYAKTKRVGYMLLDAYFERCLELKNEGKICVAVMSEVIGLSPVYTKFGLVAGETLWTI